MCANGLMNYLYVMCLLLLLASTKDSVELKMSNPAAEFSRYKVVQPIVYHGRTKREISTTRHPSGAHHPHVTIRVHIDGDQYFLDLWLNENLIADNHIVQYQHGAKSVVYKPKKEDLDLCQYSGTVRGKLQSRVAVSTCRGLRGVIYDGKVMRYIQPAEGHGIQSDHFLYDHADLKTVHRCGYNGGLTKNESYDSHLRKRYQNENRSRISRYKREVEERQVRGPYNANERSRYVELVLVSDHREFKANGESVETVHHQLKDVANIINSAYSPLNIFIALVGVVIWTERDEIQLVANANETLKNFMEYRRHTLLADIPNDNAHLITRQKFHQGIIGQAYTGAICTYQLSGGIATNHSEVIGLVAATIAHEMGHNFGMEHDTSKDCKCPDEQCIMSPSGTSVIPVHWSSCSLISLALTFQRGMDYCLRNQPKRLFGSPICGNGFVELGEQCDCGIAADACHACCAPNCTLRSHAACATGACCGLQTCQPRSAGTVCRFAERECDLPEYCNGHSEFCPADFFKMDSTPCGNEQAYCVRGSCISHTDQCRLLWGSTGESHDMCYTRNNINGNEYGNCGYDRITQTFEPCSIEDAMCGMLQCQHLNKGLEVGIGTTAETHSTSFTNNVKILRCYTAIIDMGLSVVDPGMVPDGARCGKNKMCLGQKCVSVESLQVALARRNSSVCPSSCSGNGICNSEGHCHCEPGFGPPLCMMPGPGGSYDSGPASDPSVQWNFMVAMYVTFLAITPVILLALCLVYYTRKEPKKSIQSPIKTSLQQRLSHSTNKFMANFHCDPQIIIAVSNPEDTNSRSLSRTSERAKNLPDLTRPIIRSPVLQASTCTAKDLIESKTLVLLQAVTTISPSAESMNRLFNVKSNVFNTGTVNGPTHCVNKEKQNSKEMEKEFWKQDTLPIARDMTTTTNSPDVVSSLITETNNMNQLNAMNNNELRGIQSKVAVKPTVVVKPNTNPIILNKKPAVKTKPLLNSVSSKSIKSQDNNSVNQLNSNINSKVKAMANNSNKNRSAGTQASVQGVELVKANPSKPSANPSTVASLQQKFENMKSADK